jgi:FixJ family two-component response regulator
MADRVLVAVVDDDASLLRALGRLLRGRGYEVAAYASAGAFLAALPERRPDCLLLDFRMPGMSGLELLEALKARDAGIPVIVMTAFGGDDIADRCLAAGAVAVLPKPVQDASLLHALRAASAAA